MQVFFVKKNKPHAKPCSRNMYSFINERNRAAKQKKKRPYINNEGILENFKAA